MVEEIDPDRLHRQLENGEEVQVVDIRPPAAFREGHVPGAINLPLAELPRRVDEVEWGEEIVVVCPIGQSSLQAARLIESYEGVDGSASVANLTGGYREWEYDLESGEKGGTSES